MLFVVRLIALFRLLVLFLATDEACAETDTHECTLAFDRVDCHIEDF